MDALADETLTATMIAERLTPEAAYINLIPTMPLHIAFWFGARLATAERGRWTAYTFNSDKRAYEPFPSLHHSLSQAPQAH